MYAQPIDKTAQQMESRLACYRSLQFFFFFFSCQEKLPKLLSVASVQVCAEKRDGTRQQQRWEPGINLKKESYLLVNFFSSFKNKEE